jgi:tRNA(Arg) A34 adenosine deaminase TadA
VETFAEGYERLIGAPAPPIDNPQLAHYWNLPVSQLCEIDTTALDAGLQERHRLYFYLLMAIGWNYWNGYKDGRAGTYPWNDTPGPDDPPWLSGDYRGHNIVALAADQFGRVVDFDFNHNALFNSSAEHAEARLVRRLYGLANVGSAWGPDPVSSTGTSSLSGMTVYTSLESCAQCSGIMALADVSQIVFMQTDPGEYLIGRILYNLTPPSFRAPLPISGSEVGLTQFDQLNSEFGDFVQAVPNKPFWVSADGSDKDTAPAITSFLCTSEARAIYLSGLQQLKSYGSGTSLEYPTYAPPGVAGALTNQEVLANISVFLAYAVEVAHRGTPHTI